LVVCTRSFHKSSAVKPKTDFALRSPVRHPSHEGEGALDKTTHLARLLRPEASCLIIRVCRSAQLRRCPTPFPSPKRRPATIPLADLASKSHQNQRSTPICFDVMRLRTPNRQSAPLPCGLAAARFAMQGRSGRSFQHSSKHVPKNQRPDDNDRQEHK